MAFVLLRSQSGAGTSGTSTNSVTIATTDTETIDFVNSTSLAVKWFVSVENAVASENVVYEVLVHNGGTIEWNRSGTLGDTIDHDLDIAISGPQLQFNVTNNEANDITVTIVRILIV